MKKAQSWQKHRSLLLSQLRFSLAHLRFMKVGKNALQKSFKIETKKFDCSDWKKPKIFFQIAFLFLFFAGILMMLPKNEADQQTMEIINNLGWVKRDSSPCKLKDEGFYLAEGNFQSIEFFFSSSEEIFAPTELPWPEAPVDCVALETPLRIEEL
jgi:hypothetical protein